MPVVDTVREECPPARVDSRGQRAEQGHGLRTQEACTFWKGRTALYAVLRSLEVSQGDTVLVPGYTCFAVPSAVMFTGARPVFADIDPNTFNVSLQTILKALAQTSSRTVKAVVVQHTYGMPADIRPILDWARESGVAVVEDCAHSWGSRYRDNGKWSELGSFGDAAIFSSQWTKPISTGLGGWAIANSPILRERLRHFRSLECVAPSTGESAMLAIQVLARELASSPAAYWTAKRVYQFLYRRGLLLGTSSPEEFRAEMPKGYAKRMSRFQEWLLTWRLAKTEVIRYRRSLKAIYDAALAQNGFDALRTPDYADPVLLRYPLRVTNKNQVMAEARRRGIELGDWYSHPVDLPEDSAAETFGYMNGMCREGERAACEVINLPMHTRITEKNILATINLLKEVA